MCLLISYLYLTYLYTVLYHDKHTVQVGGAMRDNTREQTCASETTTVPAA